METTQLKSVKLGKPDAIFARIIIKMVIILGFAMKSQPTYRNSQSYEVRFSNKQFLKYFQFL